MRSRQNLKPLAAIAISKIENPLYAVIVQHTLFFFKRALSRMRKNWRDFRKELEKFVKKDCNNSGF